MAEVRLKFGNKRRFRTEDARQLAQDLERLVDDLKRATVSTGSSAQILWIWGALNFNSTTVRRYMRMASSDAAVTSTEANSQVPVAFPGALTGLRVSLGVAIVGVDVTFTVRVNGSDTALTVTLAAGQTAGSVTGSVAVVAGDIVTIATDASASDVAFSSYPRALVTILPEAA